MWTVIQRVGAWNALWINGKYNAFYVQNHITPSTVVITSLLVRDKPLRAPASVKRVYWHSWWRHQMPRDWPFVRGIPRSPANSRSPVNSPHKGQWREALMFYLICAWMDGWVNNGEAGDLRRHRAHYDVTVMLLGFPQHTTDSTTYIKYNKTWGPSQYKDRLIYVWRFPC